MTAEHNDRSSPVVPPVQEYENKSSTQYLEDTKKSHPPSEKVHHGDTALALFAQNGGSYESIDPLENKRLVRKIDCMILPFLSVCYAFYYVSSASGPRCAGS